MGKSGLPELECPSQAAALLMLVLQWHCQGALGISTVWPQLKERLPSQILKKKAVTFLLTTFFVNKPPKGKGWSFPYWLVLRTAHGVGQILAMLPSSQLPLDLPCYNPQYLLGMEGGWAPGAWSYSESIKGSLYRAEICSQRLSRLASSPVLYCVSVLWQSMPCRRFICKERRLESSNSIAKS